MNIPHSSRYEKKVVSFPNRLSVSRNSENVTVSLDKHYGGQAKNVIRDAAKKCQQYFVGVEISVSGTADGKKIPIDNVGKWLFGTPGYKGHIIVENWNGSTCNIFYPKDAPTEVSALINAVKQQFS